MRLALCVILATVAVAAAAPAQTCPGDCDGGGQVTVDELVRGVNIALGALAPAACAALDVNGDGEISVNELIAAVGHALDGCGPPAATATATSTELPGSPTATDTAAPPTSTATQTSSDTATATAAPTETATPSPTATSDGSLTIAAAVARDADGVALRLGEEVTTEGVVTVDAGIFANNKLKVFAQDAGAGIMVFHQSSADVEALQSGDRVRAHGIIRQQDPTSDMNAATGTVLIDISNGSLQVLSPDNPLPDATTTTLSGLANNGNALTGTLVHLSGIRKVAGDWPILGSRSTQVSVGDDSQTTLVLRFQRNTITPPLVAALNAIGDGPFAVTAVVVQDDGDGAPLTSGYELWVRGAADIAPLP